MSKRGRSTEDGDQSSSGVGTDDRDRQGQRVQDPESPYARGEQAEGRTASGNRTASGKKRNTGSTPRSDKSGRGSEVDTGTRRGRGEKSTGESTRSGSRSNAS